MSPGPCRIVRSPALRGMALAIVVTTHALALAGQARAQPAPQAAPAPQGITAPAPQPTPPADTAKPAGAQSAQAAQPAVQAAAPSTPATTTQRRGTTYSREAVLLVVLILVLLALLFWLLLKWSHRLDQTRYLGSVYQESVEDFEYKRLATVPTEKLNKGEYHFETEQDSNWLRDHPRPTPPPGYERWGGPPGTGAGFAYPPPPGLPPPPGALRLERQRGGDPTTSQAGSDAGAAQRRAEEEYDKYMQAKAKWDQELYAEARARYQRDLASAREQAQKRASYAIDVDLSVLRGRGAEFVLEFTTVVVIIFAAIVLGVLDILGTEQIGTLLAAIAGYVLGRATTRARGGPEAKGAAEPLAAGAQGAPRPTGGK